MKRKKVKRVKPKPALQYILEGELPFLSSFSDPSIPKLFQKVKS